MMIKETPNSKQVVADTYNYWFDKRTGLFFRWGSTYDDNPDFSPYGPEIVDIEVSTICSNGCPMCYKNNTIDGTNMSFDTFKRVFDKLPPTITQIAFGIGDIDANPDLWKIMNYTRASGVIPNITINGYKMTPEYYHNLVKTCGAVAVSLYDRDTCYNTVQELTSRGLNQTYIHCIMSVENYDKCKQVLRDYHNDERLSKLKAIVFLWLKPAGQRNRHHQLTLDMFRDIVVYAEEHDIPIGFDSCSASNLKRIVGSKYDVVVAACDSTLFSVYINAAGRAFPCSFSEHGCGFQGVDVLGAVDFVNDVWFSDEFCRFRESVMLNTDENRCRMCPIYDLRC